MVENVNEGGMDSRKFLLLTTQHQFSGESHLQEIWKVLGANIWRRHFEFNVLEGDMVSFTTTGPYSAWEGAHKFLITLYKTLIMLFIQRSHWEKEKK